MEYEHLVLYRKYRPKSFDEVVGQDHVVSAVRNALAQGKVAHAYLFSGPRGVGKTTVARLIAKSLNCEGREKPCNSCASCDAFNEGRAVDLIEIDAASNRGIDEIRELRDAVRFVPSQGKYKTYVVDECLTADHLVNLADGSVRMISELRDGDEVASVDLETGRVVAKKISNHFSRETASLVHIRTTQAVIKCTPTHRLWAMRDGEIQSIQAKDVRRTDFLLSPVEFPHLSMNVLTPDQLSFLALIQCDGHVAKDSGTIQIDVAKDKKYFLKRFTNGVRAWNVQGNIALRKTNRGTMLLRFYSKELKQKLIDFGCPAGKKSNRIDIPDEVFQAPLESIKAFIDACFCCEGDAAYSPSTRLYKLSFTSVSKIFTMKLQLLLKKFGIASSIMTIERKKIKHRTAYRLNITGYDLRLFQERIGLSIERKANAIRGQLLSKEKQDGMPIQIPLLSRRKVLRIPHRVLNMYGIYLDRTQSLTRQAVKEFIEIAHTPEFAYYLSFRYEKILEVGIRKERAVVYDFTVEDTHTFLANGLCSSNCHMLTKEAFNALLKTLEEPPAHAVFVLATTELDRVPLTIVSRTQHYSFHRPGIQDIAGLLARVAKKEGVRLDFEGARMIAFAAEGSLRDAEGILGQIMAVEDKEITRDEVERILGMPRRDSAKALFALIAKKDMKTALALIQEIANQGYDMSYFSKMLLQYFRTALFLKTDPALKKFIESDFLPDELEVLEKNLPEFSASDISRGLEVIFSNMATFRRSPIPQLPLEITVVELIAGGEEGAS